MLYLSTLRIGLLSVALSTVFAGDCNEYCGKPAPEGSCCERFGLNVNRDSDVVITASTSYNHEHGPHRAALFEAEVGGIAGWAAATNNAEQWIQVDFGSPRQVTGVLLQGRGAGCCNQWVTSFRILFSNDGEIFYSTPTIEGTFDRHTVARRYLDRPIVARYVRLNPITYFGHITLRFDLLGCEAGIFG
ncbi:lactadherin-like isoform X1 [Apostichopus japonicus]|uniref:lactadherin-like isoform X1 n=1 Tax=Stichopus japonicus TaxID=307972 RepID=UPI003AB1898D